MMTQNEGGGDCYTEETGPAAILPLDDLMDQKISADVHSPSCTCRHRVTASTFSALPLKVRIPAKLATHSDAKPATHSEASRPPGRSVATTRAHGWWRWPPWPPAVSDSVIFSGPSVDLAVAAVCSCGNPGGGGRAPRISKGCGKVRGWMGGGPELSMPRQIPQPGGLFGGGGGAGAAARALLMTAPPPARQEPGSCAVTRP
jgi:hypothetical protein